MTGGIVLDGLLVAAILLYVPIGALRGGLRETILGGSILLGAAFVVTRPGSWGQELASVAGMAPRDGAFAVALACLAASIIIIGVGGGALCDRRVPSWRGRILGAGIGAVNATILIAFVLISHEEIRRDGIRSDSVAESYLAGTLVDHVDLVLLAAVGIGALAVLAGHLTNRIIGVSFDTDLEPALTWLQSTQRPPRTVRIPAEADAGKVEPVPRVFRSGSTPDAIGATRPMYAHRADGGRSTPDRDGWTDRPRPEDDSSPMDDAVASNGGSNQDASLAELRRLLRIGPESGHGDRTSGWSFVEPRAPASPHVHDDRAIQPSEYAPSGGPPPGRCHRCDTVLPDPTLPCPFCDDRR